LFIHCSYICTEEDLKVDDFLFVVLGVLMDNWKERIREYYSDLLKSIETKYALRGELIQLQSSTFPEQLLNAIWVIFVQIFFSYFILLTVVGMSNNNHHHKAPCLQRLSRSLFCRRLSARKEEKYADLESR